MYATLPQDSATSVFINIHTGTGLPSTAVTYSDGVETTTIMATQFSLKGIEPRGDRKFYTTLLTNLKPRTVYNLTVQSGDQIYKTT